MTVSIRSYAGMPVADRRSQRRERFIEAGLAVFGTSGYQSSSVTSLCAAAGLDRSQFYEHFTNREDLLLEVYDRIQGDARSAVVAAVESVADSTDLTAKLRRAVTAYAESIGSDPGRASISFVEVGGISERVEQHRLEQRALWADFLIGEVRDARGPDYTPPGGYTAAATGFIGSLMALVQNWCRPGSQITLAELVEALSSYLSVIVGEQ